MPQATHVAPFDPQLLCVEPGLHSSFASQQPVAQVTALQGGRVAPQANIVRKRPRRRRRMTIAYCRVTVSVKSPSVNPPPKIPSTQRV
jgi:hypothetical protein